MNKKTTVDEQKDAEAYRLSGGCEECSSTDDIMVSFENRQQDGAIKFKRMCRECIEKNQVIYSL